jgi:hypothetical protein
MTPRALAEHEKSAVNDLWRSALPHHHPDDLSRLIEGDPDWQPEYTRVVEQDGRLAAAAHIVRRVLQCGPFMLTLGGLTGLAARKGQIDALRACAQQAIAVMQADAMDLSLALEDPYGILPPLGYSELERSRTTFDLTEANLPLPCARPYTADDDEPVRRLYRQWSSRRTGTVRRSDAYWRSWMGLADGHSREPTRILVQNNRVTGFYQMEHGTATEFVWEDASALRALLADAAFTAHDDGWRHLVLDLPPEPALRECSAELELPMEAAPALGMYGRVLHRDTLLRGLSMHLSDRWSAAGSPWGRIDFETPEGCVSVIAEAPFLRIESSDSGGMPQAALLDGLLGCGWAKGDNLYAALFPTVPGGLNTLDHF